MNYNKETKSLTFRRGSEVSQVEFAMIAAGNVEEPGQLVGHIVAAT